ncbi:MAG: endopeptidase La [Acidobacteria bacterium]|nr:endopeptidase La [Acidobacteriota bacterium]MCY4662250.1 endopeptidase La [Acidobacteriota bacterium]
MEAYETLPIVPLRDVVVFPHMMMPFVIGRRSSTRALEHALLNDKRIFLAAQKDAANDDPNPNDIYTMGCVANIVQSLKLPDGNVKVLVEGIDRARTIEWKEDKGFFRVVAKVLPRQPDTNEDVESTMSKVVSLFEQYVKLSNTLQYDAMIAAVRVDDPSKLGDTIAAHLVVGVDEKQNLLEIISPLERLVRIASILETEVDKLQVDRRIQSRVKKQMEKAQKEYYLNEKMKAIQKELGRKEDRGNEVDDLRRKIEESKMPPDVGEKAMQELKRLEAMPPMSAEATVSRNYLDWLIAVPWHKRTRESRNLKRAETILNEDHYGLEKIKDRILEFLAVRSLVRKPRGTILTFTGPPGVGKTSLAKSIARATSRKFVRLSLGGVRDEAEIRGHRRTYIGAFPGQIIQMMKKAGTVNPVFLLDEVDKMSMDFRGDPSAALLEVLDPEQNNAFLDHYLDVEFDLSHVMFICTANVLHTVPQALRDRMEVLQLAGYTELEKIEIARRFLLPKALPATGLSDKNVRFADDAYEIVIRRYTREAGVRSLEREIASICRKIARKVVVDGKSFSTEVTGERISEYLGVPKYRPTLAEDKNEIGIATGLAWTEAGGELLLTESTLMPGKGQLTLTGKLGDVMQESAQAAMSYVRAKAEDFGIPKEFNKKTDVHVHVPEGAIPKDGPSAGITITTALVSTLARVPTRRDVAMTGEITLRGKVLPVGGVKEKVLAAHRANLKTIILPKDNEKDLADIPKEVLDSLNLYMVDTMDEVLKIALAEQPVPMTPTAESPEVAADGRITH